MVSMGADILELSEAPEHIAPGQTRPTVSKSKLREVSVVDIGSNDDALRLTYEGKALELGADMECGLPVLKINSILRYFHTLLANCNTILCFCQ